MNLNFNSTSASHYTLYCSNEETELYLADRGSSSASNFKVTLIPSLDLNQLSLFQSTEVEVKISNLSIDSPPLTFADKETINTYITIDPKLARDNFIYESETLDSENDIPLAINVGDFHAIDSNTAINYLNQLLLNSSNLFVLKRYCDLLLDCHLFKEEVFTNLDIDTFANILPGDCELLRHYVDIAIYTRTRIIAILNNYVNKKRLIRTLYNPDHITYKNTIFSKAKETETLQQSELLRPITGRAPAHPSIFIDPPIDPSIDPASNSRAQIIITKNFYGLNLGVDFENQTKSKKTILNRADEEIKNELKQYLTDIGKLNGNQVTPENIEYIEQIISDQVLFLSIGRTIQTLIHNEQQRLRTHRNTKIFARPLLSVIPDSSGLKCRFIIDRTKNIEHMTYKIAFPSIVSYKLGSEKNIASGKYENILVGPISLVQPTSYKQFSNKITHDRQRLCSPFRINPKLLCLGTDILSECNRQTSKEQFLFQRDDVIIFYQMLLKSNKNGSNPLVLPFTESYKQEFYKVHKARNFLSSFKISLYDENGMQLNFMRQTIIKLALTFRPAPNNE